MDNSRLSGIVSELSHLLFDLFLSMKEYLFATIFVPFP